MTRVPADLKPRLQRVARAKGMTLSDLVSDVLEDYVPEAEDEEGLPQQGEFTFDLKKTA